MDKLSPAGRAAIVAGIAALEAQLTELRTALELDTDVEVLHHRIAHRVHRNDPLPGRTLT